MLVLTSHKPRIPNKAKFFMQPSRQTEKEISSQDFINSQYGVLCKLRLLSLLFQMKYTSDFYQLLCVWSVVFTLLLSTDWGHFRLSVFIPITKINTHIVLHHSRTLSSAWL